MSKDAERNVYLPKISQATVLANLNTRTSVEFPSEKLLTSEIFIQYKKEKIIQSEKSAFQQKYDKKKIPSNLFVLLKKTKTDLTT